MKRFEVTVPEVALVALTRGMGGIGIGLLAAGTMRARTRRIAGMALLAVGVLSTIPLVLQIFAKRPPIDGRISSAD
jgi:hypothetical protein